MLRPAVIVLAILLWPNVACASLSAQTVWEVRTAGSDNNGGGFVAGATGTDYSQQASAQYTATDLTVDASANTKVTSVSHAFSAADVGNIMHITTGTGFAAGWYQILSVSGGAATLDRSPAATSTAGGAFYVGGALATLSQVNNAMVSHNKVFIKADGVYTTGTGITMNVSGGVNPNSQFNQLIGYAGTRGDNGFATIQASAGSLTVLTISSNGWKIRNLTLDCNNQSSCTGFYSSFGSILIYRNRAINYTVNGIYTQGNANNGIAVVDNEVTGGSGTAINSTSGIIVLNYVHDDAGLGIYDAAQPGTVASNIVSNITGASGDCITMAFNTYVVLNNTVNGCGRDGIAMPQPINIPFIIKNNIISNAARYCLAMTDPATGTPASQEYDGNAFYDCGTANRYHMDDTTSNAQNGVVPYTNTQDVQLSYLPFVSSNDFTLNATGGGGAAVRNTGQPASWPGLSSVGYPDFGAIVHFQSAGGAGGSYVFGN